MDSGFGWRVSPRLSASAGKRGWRVDGGCFPVQTVLCRGVADAHETLLRLGIQTVPQKAGLSFVLTARHTQSEVEQAARALCSTWLAPDWRKR